MLDCFTPTSCVPALDHSGVNLSTAVVASHWRRHDDYCSRLANTSALNSLIVKTWGQAMQWPSSATCSNGSGCGRYGPGCRRCSTHPGLPRLKQGVEGGYWMMDVHFITFGDRHSLASRDCNISNGRTWVCCQNNWILSIGHCRLYQEHLTRNYIASVVFIQLRPTPHSIPSLVKGTPRQWN